MAATISVINFSDRSDEDVQDAIRAVNRQASEDFAPVWGLGWELRLHASAFDPSDPTTLENEPVRGDGVIYFINDQALSGALGYHDLNARAIPFGFVFDLDERSDDWTVTLSHEALEMMLDPLASALVPGPNPKDGNLALHTYEVCDAVERTDYDIDGVRVSNFVTPSFFTVGDEPATRNDFLGIGVESFRALPGSHLAYFRLDTNRWETHVEANLPRNARAAARFDEKNLPEPKTPRDEVAIQGVLEAYKNGKPPAPGCRGLPDLRAVSRNGKYMSSLPDGSGAGRGGNGAQPHSDVAEREASRTTT